jgi:DNA-binding transcriptional regulator LsrR (DeoR family)
MYVFVSHAAEDEYLVRKEIVGRLENEGIPHFLSEKIESGYLWSEKVKEALKQCTDMIVFITKKSLHSEWVISEWSSAWALDKNVIPVLFRCDPADLQDILRERQCRDLHEIDQVIEEIKERDEIRAKWWEIKHVTTSDERACAKVFHWTASGMSTSEVLWKRDDEDWKISKWGPDPDENTIETMLMRAWDDNVIHTPADRIPQDHSLEGKLKDAFPVLRNGAVKVVRSSQSELLTKILVGEVAAYLFDRIVRSTYKVGMSGGTTLATMARALKKYPCVGISLYALENGLTPEAVDTCANTLIGWIKHSHPSARIKAHALQYLGFDDSPEPQGFPPDHPSIREVLSEARDVDAAFVGFWPITKCFVENNPSFKIVLKIADIKPDDLIEEDRAVGTILFHCIREDGELIENRLNRRIDSVRPERLVELAERGRPIVGIGCGALKGRAGLGLLNGGYVNNMVIDDKLAWAILKRKSQFDNKNV